MKQLFAFTGDLHAGSGLFPFTWWYTEAHMALSGVIHELRLLGTAGVYIFLPTVSSLIVSVWSKYSYGLGAIPKWSPWLDFR